MREITLPSRKSNLRRNSEGEENMNERKTEGLVRKRLESNKEEYPYVTIEEKKSDNPRINKLLKTASKTGMGVGRPEFLLSFENYPDLLMVVECKSDISKHMSKNRDNYKDFAVDGVLLYSSYLSKEFDVIAIAVSGETEKETKVSNFLQLKNKKVKGVGANKILDFNSYFDIYRNDPEKERLSVRELIKYSKVLNNKLRDDFELEEGQRPLLVSGILIALEDEAFTTSYIKEKRAIDLAKSLTKSIEKILEQHNVEQKKKADMVNVYSFIETNNNIAEDLNQERNTKLRDMITEIKDKVQGFTKDYKFHDVLGMFYSEFLRYANGDKGLGIVLTPRHITWLFSEIAQVNKDSVVIDNCCGTGGFLISAMKKMIDDAQGDTKKVKEVYKKQLIGIENNPKMFCLTCSNMLLRGDGKANVFYNTCFGIEKEQIKKLKPTIGFLNPPYSKKKAGSEELNYILNCLDFLEKNGICIAIVPLACATAPSTFKEKLLENHTLEAVMSMPSELFSPINVITCIMVFRAHVPHKENIETWFGYWRDDGFVKTKNEGRVNKYEQWDKISRIWLDDFRNRREVGDRCVRQKVGCDDEWCAEAYMKTDYSGLTKEDFVKEIKEYVVFRIKNGADNG